MNKRNPLAQVPVSIKQFVTQSPAYPWSGPGLFRRLKEVVDLAECGPGPKLPFWAFGQLIGAATPTAHDWMEGDLPHPMQALLCGLERLPETEWIRCLREFLRQCVRLEHPSLARDQEATDSLNDLISHPEGLIIIRGGSLLERSFLLNALGNSSRRCNPMRRICGLDVLGPPKFAPVLGVYYVRRCLESGQLRQVATEMWPLLRTEACEVLVLNGVLSAAPETLRDVIKTSKTRLVILADDFTSGLPKCKASIVTVTKNHRKPGLFRINIRRSG